MSQTSAPTSLSQLNIPAQDLAQGTWISRVWIPGAHAGPAVVLLKDGQVYDISARVATVSALLELDDPVAYLRSLPLEHALISFDALLGNSDTGPKNRPRAIPPRPRAFARHWWKASVPISDKSCRAQYKPPPSRTC